MECAKQVRKTSLLRLTVVQFLVWIGLGILLAQVVTCSIWYVPVTIYVTELLALITHVLGHTRSRFWLIRLWRDIHMDHHVRHYPLKRFLSDPPYREADIDNGVAYIPALILGPLIVGFLFQLSQSFIAIVLGWILAAILLKLADWLHQAFHLRGHFLEEYDWFLELRQMHYLHHLGSMKHNFAIGNFLFDFLLFGFKMT